MLSSALAGRYEIDREIGHGGNARVYLARDLKHGRTVAIKVLRPELSSAIGPDRFLREIQITATLQHPHILPLHDSGIADGLLFYVMPYVAGESLRARLDRERQLPVDEAVFITQTIARALDHAHRNGFIHRDVKPDNILLGEGQPILSDFGIALALPSAQERVTATGISVGTLEYMSPEQAGGDRTLSPASDIYSLGAVAYEMLTGEPPTTGSDARTIAMRIMTALPQPIRPVRPTVPVSVEAAILKALAKTPADRFRTANEFAAALAGAVPSAAVREDYRVRTGIGVGAIVVVAAALLAFIRNREPDPFSSVSRHRVTFVGNAVKAAITPDGRTVAFAVQAGDSFLVLAQDEGGGRADTLASLPRVVTMEWSPDGTRLLIGSANRSVILPRLRGTQRTLPVSGRVCALVQANWLPDGRRVSRYCAGDTHVLITDLETADTVSIELSGSYSWLWRGSWSPDGRRLALATESVEPHRYAIQTVALDGRMTRLLEDSVPLDSPQWGRDGEGLYYLRGGEALRYVRTSLLLSRGPDTPREVQSQLEAIGSEPSSGAISLTGDGQRIVYARGTRFSNLSFLEGEPGNRTQQLTSGTAMRWSPAVSPDGRWIAFVQQQQGSAELFKMPATGGMATQITFGARVWRPSRIAWSRNGDRIAFASVRGGRANVWVTDVEGGQMRSFPTTQISTNRGHLSWGPGTSIAYLTADHHNIQLLDPNSGSEQPLISDPRDTRFVFSPQYSPDGNLLAVYEAGVGIRVFDLRRPSEAGDTITQNAGWPVGWSLDGLHVISSWNGTLSKVDIHKRDSSRRLATLPFRHDCYPAFRVRPTSFICTVSDFASDIWMIEAAK